MVKNPGHKGKFIGIGTGPGSPDLLTLRAVQALQSLDILYTPSARAGKESLAYQIVEPHLKEGLEVRKKHFPMTRDQEKKKKAWDGIAQEIRQEVASGKRVGFVTLGDPMVYSTYSYILDRMEGLPRETLAGLSSYAYMANQVQVPLVKDLESLAVLPALAPKEDLVNALDHFSTIVIMKVYSKASQVRALLEEKDLLDQAVLVSDGGTDHEKIVEGLESWHPEEGLSYFSTIIVYKNRFQEDQ